MASVSVFRARYTDETSLYEHLRKIFPTGLIEILSTRSISLHGPADTYLGKDGRCENNNISISQCLTSDTREKPRISSRDWRPITTKDDEIRCLPNLLGTYMDSRLQPRFVASYLNYLGRLTSLNSGA
ncbi:hypothetical protein F4818DRAFT_78582 [Hypoxylon cercidicola]|nr:hypothetical protein F4818DRAFT_78582 [Hypoxylon cercidicola]